MAGWAGQEGGRRARQAGQRRRGRGRPGPFAHRQPAAHTGSLQAGPDPSSPLRVDTLAPPLGPAPPCAGEVGGPPSLLPAPGERACSLLDAPVPHPLPPSFIHGPQQPVPADALPLSLLSPQLYHALGSHPTQQCSPDGSARSPVCPALEPLGAPPEPCRMPAGVDGGGQ